MRYIVGATGGRPDFAAGLSDTNNLINRAQAGDQPVAPTATEKK